MGSTGKVPSVNQVQGEECRPREERFCWKGTAFRFLVWEGPRAAAPVVLLHGFAQSAQSWADVAPLLACERTVYALDLVGHGRSDRPLNPEAYSLEAQAHAVVAFALSLRPAKPAVVGYSMGGRVALAAASYDQQVFGALILEGAGLGPATAEERASSAKRDADSAARLRAEGIEAFMDSWEQAPLFATQQDLPADVRARVRAGRLANNAEALARTFEQAGQHVMPSCTETTGALRRLAALDTPMLYLVGSLDQKYRALAASLSKAMPDVPSGTFDRCVIEGAGHNVHLEAPAVFALKVNGFLAMR